jgi:hypothetical protein
MLRLFWIDFPPEYRADLPVGTQAGIGVTAADEADALELVRSDLFSGQQLPKHHSMRTLPDLDALEQNHVRPNLGNHMRRGIWYPAKAGW